MDYPSSFLGEEPPAVSTPPRHTRRVEERKKAYPTRIKTGGIRLKKICGFALVRRKGRSYAVLSALFSFSLSLSIPHFHIQVTHI